MAYTFQPDLKTVVPDGGTPFKTEQEALNAGVIKNPTYDQSSPNSPTNPYYSNVTFPGTVSGTIPASTVTAATTPQPSAVEMYNQYLTSSGYAPLVSQEAEQKAEIARIKAQELGSEIGMEGRGVITPVTEARQRELAKETNRLLTPKLIELGLTQDKIKAITDTIDRQMGYFQQDRTFAQGQAEFQYQVTQDIAAAKQQGISNELAIQQAILKVPVGQSITVGGKTYQGLDDTQDVYTVKEEDANGQVTVIGLDKNTGKELYRNDLGTIGTGTKGTTTDVGGRSEILGVLQGAVNAANFGDTSQYEALPSYLKAYVKAQPVNIGGFPLTGADGKPLITYTVNEPTEKQYLELAKLVEAEQAKPQSSGQSVQSNISAPELEKLIMGAIKAGDSDETIADDLLSAGFFKTRESALKAVKIYR